jgi:cell division septation protein DedD
LIGVFVVALALLTSLAAPAWADYETGAAAARRGNYATALREWRPLAEQGHPQALIELGFMYANGHGVAKDEAEALRLYRRAAEQGAPLGQFNTGYMYLNGLGTEQDPAEGLRWYRRAADQGFVAAQFNLGVRYYSGESVERDLPQAYFWFALADRGGHGQAAQPVEALAAQIEPDERQALDAQVRAWEPSAPPAAAPLPDVSAVPPAAEPLPDISDIPAVSPPPEPARPAPGVALVQLGALRSREAALREWQRLEGPHGDLLEGLQPRVERIDLGPGRGVFYRLRAGPLASEAAASQLCEQLRARQVGCLLVALE